MTIFPAVGGDVLVWGGFSPPVLYSDLWLFDTTSQTWSQLEGTSHRKKRSVSSSAGRAGKDASPDGGRTGEEEFLRVGITDEGLLGGGPTGRYFHAAVATANGFCVIG